MSDTVREFFMGEGPGFSDHLQYFIFGRGYKRSSFNLIML